jgi:hypothetical protein
VTSAISPAVRTLATYDVLSTTATASDTRAISRVLARRPTTRWALAIGEMLTAVAATDWARTIGGVISTELVLLHSIGSGVQSFQVRSNRRHFMP